MGREWEPWHLVFGGGSNRIGGRESGVRRQKAKDETFTDQ